MEQLDIASRSQYGSTLLRTRSPAYRLVGGNSEIRNLRLLPLQASAPRSPPRRLHRAHACWPHRSVYELPLGYLRRTSSTRPRSPTRGAATHPLGPLHRPPAFPLQFAQRPFLLPKGRATLQNAVSGSRLRRPAEQCTGAVRRVCRVALCCVAPPTNSNGRDRDSKFRTRAA